MRYAYVETLLRLLPRYAEEEGDFYAVHRDVLVSAITEKHGIPSNIAETAVGFCERLLETLSVLNAGISAEGRMVLCLVLRAIDGDVGPDGLE
jgi:hypothetical protein